MDSNRCKGKEVQVHYPRTGKRGVPQQFPRKLYDMLEFESGSFAVEWIGSGRGFRITNVEYFSEIILPKWFKTSKFSSFQRNLNLYGFTKSRKKNNTVYSHPHFSKGSIGELSKIRKRDSPTKKRNQERGGLHRVHGIQPCLTETNVQKYPGFQWVSARGRLDMLTEAMQLVIESESKMMYNIAGSGSIVY